MDRRTRAGVPAVVVVVAVTARKRLELGDLRLPLDVVTETIGWVGNRGSGKSNAARVAAEEMIRAGDQIVAVDPVDAWYGLAYGATKAEAGLPVYVFGGAHGQLPLESTAGALLADVVVERGISAVFSLRHLPKAQQRRFMADFAARLYLRKGTPEYRTALHVFIEEAHTFAPQGQISTKDANTSECLGAVQDLVLQGRGSGIGVSLITQRVAALSRSVLELAEILCAFRTSGPAARKALKDWFDSKADDAARLAEFTTSVAGLKRGEAYVWSPGYLDLFELARFRKVDTYDSSATPERGKRVAPLGKVAPVDVDKLGAEILATVERVKADDPKTLRAEISTQAAEIARLEALLANQPVEVERVEVEVEVRVPFIPEDVFDRVRKFTQRVADLGVECRVVDTMLDVAHRQLPPRETAPQNESRPVVAARAPLPPASHKPSGGTAPVPDGDVNLGKREKAILEVLVTHGPKTTNEIAQFTGYRKTASTIGAGISSLRKAGLVVDAGGKRVEATAAARALGLGSTLPTGRALLDHWRGKLGKREVQILDVLVESYPRTLTGDEISERTEYKPPSESSSIGAGMSSLRKFGLVDGWSLAPTFAEAVGL